MASEHVRRDDDGGVVTVTFARDEKLNAVNMSMINALREAAEDLAANDDLRVLVITAEGRYFTSGQDVAELQPRLGVGADGVVRSSNVRRDYRSHANHDLYDFFESIEKPVILAPQAACFGIGVEMGVSCDFRLASDRAVFSLPEVANLAVIPGSGGISRLARLIGPHWTKWLAMAGETIDAQQALTIGLIHDVYPAAEFHERVQVFAHKLAQMPREALGLVKILVDNAVTADRRSARDVDRLAQSLLLTSDEHHAKVADFMSRSPRPG
jgi:enoyl-CoA hydratase